MCAGREPLADFHSDAVLDGRSNDGGVFEAWTFPVIGRVREGGVDNDVSSVCALDEVRLGHHRLRWDPDA